MPRRFANSYGLCKYQVANEGCVDASGRRYACTSTEESSSLRASASLRVKTSLCTRATILKDEETDGRVDLSENCSFQTLISLARSISKQYRCKFIFGLQIVCEYVYKFAQDRNVDTKLFV